MTQVDMRTASLSWDDRCLLAPAPASMWTGGGASMQAAGGFRKSEDSSYSNGGGGGGGFGSMSRGNDSRGSFNSSLPRLLSERFAWISGGRGGFGGGSGAFGSGSDGQSRGRSESDRRCRSNSGVSFSFVKSVLQLRSDWTHVARMSRTTQRHSKSWRRWFRWRQSRRIRFRTR